MALFFAGLLAILAGGILAIAVGGSSRAANATGAISCVVGCLLGLVSSVESIISETAVSYKTAWNVPYGSLNFSIDPLSAFFLVPLFVLSGLAAVYGAGYLSYHEERRLGPPWFFYNVLVVAMALVLTAANGVLFMMAWEAMAISSFILVMFDHHDESARKAGWTYLIASHLGAAFLFAMFIALGGQAGSLEFSSFPGSVDESVARIVFLLAFAGFGAKAGFMPFHVWLPEAHPAAPSHVSALMSGVMIKMGIYGILRTLTFLGQPEGWWGLLMVAVGIITGVTAALLALGQSDFKRLLAYSSVENMGIITAAAGIGVIGASEENSLIAALGFGGALYHTVNHSVFKGLLFMVAGSTLARTHTRMLTRLGGLMKNAPVTGAACAAGCVAICGLPPLNGFMSELLVYIAAFSGIKSSSSETLMAAGAAALAGLSLIGGLAAAVFAKAFGAAFLGQPRSPEAAKASDPNMAMKAPMVILACAALALGLGAPLAPYALAAPAGFVSGLDAGGIDEAFGYAGKILGYAAAVSAVLALFIGVMVFLRRRLAKGRAEGTTVTWDCGYAAPSVKMQYSASSFAQPSLDYFKTLIRQVKTAKQPEGYFPAEASFSTRVEDYLDKAVYGNVFNAIGWAIGKAHTVRTFGSNVYIFYTTLAVIALLAVSFGFSK